MRPVTVMGDDVVEVAKEPPGVEVARQEVTGDPPLKPGEKVTVAWWLPAVALTEVGGSGVVNGVTLFDSAEAAPVPAAFVARTLKVYAVPFASPGTGIGESVPVAVTLPGVEVTR